MGSASLFVARSLKTLRGTALHGLIVRMSFEMIFRARATVVVQNLLTVPRLSHCVAISAAEASGVSDASASCYGVPENILVLAVVEPEGKLVQVERQILPADVMERAHDSPLQQAPEAVDVAGVNRSPNVLASGVAHGPMSIAKPAEFRVALVLVGSYQRYFIADG